MPSGIGNGKITQQCFLVSSAGETPQNTDRIDRNVRKIRIYTVVTTEGTTPAGTESKRWSLALVED
jgi:hypothetical protein